MRIKTIKLYQDLKFNYNPFNKDFIKSGYLHSLDLQGKVFKDYIRGIIINNVLYLRAYYPYNPDDISGFTLQELYFKSTKILDLYIKDLLKAIKKHYKIIPKTIIYNADKDLKIKGIS